MKKTFLISLLLSFLLTNSYCNSLIKKLEATGKHSIFINILESNPLFLSIVNNSVVSTIFAPTDAAFDKMPESFKKDIKQNNIKVTTKLILSHIFSGDSLKKDNIKNDGMVLSLDGSIYYTYKVGDLFVKDIVIQGEPFISNNFRVIPVECVMFLQQSSKDKRLDIEIREKYALTTCCLQTDIEFNEFYKGLK
jgi:hypothetical protein